MPSERGLAIATEEATSAPRPRPVPVIDFHAHLLERLALETALPHSVVTGFGTSYPPPAEGTAYARVMQASFEPEEHVAALDRLGIDAEVLSSNTVTQPLSWAPEKRAAELHRRINDEIARWVDAYPRRLIGSFTVPLQSRRAAEAEFLRCAGELMLRVVQLPACHDGVYIGEPDFRYLWEMTAENDVVVFIHPEGVRDPWFQKYSLWNSVGQPIEEAKCIASLIYEGILDDFPQLKIVVAHGGGYIPHYFGRLDRNVTAWPQSTANISRKPSEYFRSLYFDTCLYAPEVLAALVDRVGADRLVLGSDFPIGDTDPVGFVSRCERLSPAEARMVLGGTAANLLGLTAAEPRGVTAPTHVADE